MKLFSRVSAGLLALCLALCLLPLTAKADNEVTSGTCGDNLTWSFEPETGTLTIDGSGPMYDYYNTDRFVVENPWEDYLRDVKTIIIGAHVTDLGRYAFHDAYNVTEIRFYAQNMVDQSWDKFHFSTLGMLSGGAKVTIGAEVTRIPAGLFDANSHQEDGMVTEVQFESGSVCTEIGDRAFNANHWLTRVVGVPECLKRVGKGAFLNCSNLSEIYLPDTLTEIGQSAFCNTAFTEMTIPSGVTVISKDAFDYCQKLEKITLHDNITEIGQSAISNCPKLTEIRLPANLETVGKYALMGTGLTELDIPAKVKTVGTNAFAVGGLKVARIYSEAMVKELTQASGCGRIVGVGQLWVKKTLEPHISAWLAEQYAYICEQQYKGEDFIVFSKEFIAAHTHLIATEWSSDETGHWHSCHGCDEKADFEAHRYTDACDAECNTCGYIRTVTHSYSDTWSTDSKKHWHQCSVCGNKADESAHIPGPAATETSAQTCTTCGYVLQAPLGHEHSFGAAWQTDAFSHWRVCACGAKADEGSHIWDGGTVTQPPQAGQTGTRVYTCTTCGAQKSETIDALPPETDSEPAPTEPAPTEPAPTEPAPKEPVPTQTTPLMLRIVKSPWTWVICGGILLLTIVLTIFLIVDKKHPEEK